MWYHGAALPACDTFRIPIRTRNARACDWCKKVKSKCEELFSSASGMTSCRRCQRLGLVCTFTKAPTRRHNPANNSAAPFNTIPGALVAQIHAPDAREIETTWKRRRADDNVTVKASPEVAFIRERKCEFNETLESFVQNKQASEVMSPPSPVPPVPTEFKKGLAQNLPIFKQCSNVASAAGCCLSDAGVNSSASKSGHVFPIQAASLPPAVASFVAYEEARTDLPAPMIFMQNSHNSNVSFRANQAFQDRVISISDSKQQMSPTCCPAFINSGALLAEDMERMFMLVESSSQGLKGPSPTGEIIERSVKIEMPQSVRIRVRPTVMLQPETVVPTYPYVPCYVTVHVIVAIAPDLEAVQVTFVARPVQEVVAFSSRRSSGWFPTSISAPGAVAGSTAAALATLPDKIAHSTKACEELKATPVLLPVTGKERRGAEVPESLPPKARDRHPDAHISGHSEVEQQEKNGDQVWASLEGKPSSSLEQKPSSRTVVAETSKLPL